MAKLLLKARTYESSRDSVAVGNVNRQSLPSVTAGSIGANLGDHCYRIAVCPLGGM
jgi:hypothetical protein